MANVLTDEKPAENIEPVNAPSIREAILDRIPDDPNIVRDVRLHDGIADISLRWRTLRWATNMSTNYQTPDEIGEAAAKAFRSWLVGTLNNTNDTPRHARVLQDMEHWMAGQHEGIWADITKARNSSGGHKWLIAGESAVIGKTDFGVSA